VADIRSREVSVTMCRDLSREFDVSPSEIKNILTGKTYAWLPGAKEIPPQFTRWKLTPEQVRDIIIRARNGKWGIKSRLAEEYGVSNALISEITNNKRLYAYLVSDTQ